MVEVRTHFENRAAELADCASLSVAHRDGATWLALRPVNQRAVGVVLYYVELGGDIAGTVSLDDQASVPAELGGPFDVDAQAIDGFIEIAVQGRATAYHRKSTGGCVEEQDHAGKVTRSYLNAIPLPGWRRRWTRVQYEPYR